MQVLDSVLSDAVERGAVPYAVAMVGNRDGVVWEGAANAPAQGWQAGADTTFRLWSMTKGIGSLALMVLVDRGQLTLDTPVADLVPAFDDLQVIESVGGARGLVTRPAKTRATVRHLLTHTSGLAYPLYNPKMIAFMEATGRSYVSTGSVEELKTPLMFDPGTGWTYGIGVEWCGYLIQELTGRSIDEFCTDEVLRPLEMNNTVFEPELASAPPAPAYVRASDSAFAPTDFSPPAHPEIYGMGGALYSTAADYMRFLRLVLGQGELDGHRIVSQRAMDLMTQNQMGDMRVPRLQSLDQTFSEDVNLVFADTPVTHTAAFMRTEADIPHRRSAGSLWWAGFLNTHFWIDPARDVAALFMTQSLPFCDRKCMQAFSSFERAVYAETATPSSA